MNFVNFDRRVINKFSDITAFLTDVLKKSKKIKLQNFELTSATKKAFNNLENVFFAASILLHFNFKRKIKVKTSVSKFEIFVIISQLIEFTSQ